MTWSHLGKLSVVSTLALAALGAGAALLARTVASHRVQNGIVRTANSTAVLTTTDSLRLYPGHAALRSSSLSPYRRVFNAYELPPCRYLPTDTARFAGMVVESLRDSAGVLERDVTTSRPYGDAYTESDILDRTTLATLQATFGVGRHTTEFTIEGTRVSWRSRLGDSTSAARETTLARPAFFDGTERLVAEAVLPLLLGGATPVLDVMDLVLEGPDYEIYISALPLRLVGRRRIQSLGDSEAWVVEIGTPPRLEIWFDLHSTAVLGWHDRVAGESGCERMYVKQTPIR